MFSRKLWLTVFKTTAYKDQTGREHSGYVVYDRITVVDTGERYDVDDGYARHANHGRVYANADAPTQRFKIHTETVDYSGGTHVKPLFKYSDAAPSDARWRVANYNKEACVNPDGTALE